MDLQEQNEIIIPAGKILLRANLTIPDRAKGIIIFSHGSGSSRLSPRNRQVARFLQEKSFGTLLLDLLTPEEDRQYHNRFDIELLTSRLCHATEWVEELREAKNCSVGYFGASTGAASALKAASRFHEIEAVVCRGGRPDLVFTDLSKVAAPTLLIVGGLDKNVLELNQQAYEQLTCTKKLDIIPGASHLFEEPGKMEKVSTLAAEWFLQHLFRMAVY
jgi:putative phosphoribosyl transferase